MTGISGAIEIFGVVFLFVLLFALLALLGAAMVGVAILFVLFIRELFSFLYERVRRKG